MEYESAEMRVWWVKCRLCGAESPLAPTREIAGALARQKGWHRSSNGAWTCRGCIGEEREIESHRVRVW